MKIQKHTSDLPQIARIITQLHSVAAIKRYSPRICYVLSGGAAKGFAHLGMIDVLQTLGFLPSSIVGCSAGALVGGIYAHYLDVGKSIKHFKEIQQKKVYKDFSRRYFSDFEKDDRFSNKVSVWVKQAVSIANLIAQNSYVTPRDAEALFKSIFEGVSFNDCKVPFSACVAEVVSGETVLIGSGDIAKAVMASSAIFGVFPVVTIGREHCTDGGAISNLPSEEASKRWPDSMLVGFDVSSPVAINPEKYSPKPAELLFRIMGMSTGNKVLRDRKRCDFVFNPIDKAFSWSGFDDMDMFIELGRKHAEKMAGFFIMAYLTRMTKNIMMDWNPVMRIVAGVAVAKAKSNVKKILVHASSEFKKKKADG